MEAAAWVWPAIVLTMVGLVLAFVWFDLRETTRGRVRRILRCPLRQRQASVLFFSDFLHQEHYRDVLACSLLPEGSVDCAMACLRLTKDEIVGQEHEASLAAARRTPFGVPPQPLTDPPLEERD
jgi:hypothetical protein